MNNIGEVIKRYRVECNMTQEELGKQVFVTKQAVSKWENNRTMPDLDAIRKLTDILHIPHEEILGGTIVQAQKDRRWIRILLPIVAMSLLVALFAVLDGFGIIGRRMQGGTAVLTVYEDGNAVEASRYAVQGDLRTVPGINGYSFKIGYGPVKGTIVTAHREEVEFGFINTNSWHNVQIAIRIDTDAAGKTVTQTVTYKTDQDRVDVLQTEARMGTQNKASVFREGV